MQNIIARVLLLVASTRVAVAREKLSSTPLTRQDPSTKAKPSETPLGTIESPFKTLSQAQQAVQAREHGISVFSPSAKVFDVTEYGAKGDGKTVDSVAVRAAASACAKAGGGTLLFPGPQRSPLSSKNEALPQRAYVTGAFNLSSNMRVEIEEQVRLLGSQEHDGSDWPLIVVEEVWPGFGFARDSGGSHSPVYSESGRLMHQSLLFAWKAKNVSVGGGGTIDCRGGDFENCANNLTKPPCSGYARPQCVFFSNSTGVVFEDVTVLNSPDWTLHFSSVDELRVRRVNVTQPGGGNRDGIDIDSCRDVVVEDSFFASGDDTLAVKSGINFFGRRYNRPSRDIVFRNISTGQGYGITIGSEVSGGIRNVTFEGITVHHQTAGIHIKAPSGRGACELGLCRSTRFPTS